MEYDPRTIDDLVRAKKDADQLVRSARALMENFDFWAGTANSPPGLPPEYDDMIKAMRPFGGVRGISPEAFDRVKDRCPICGNMMARIVCCGDPNCPKRYEQHGAVVFDFPGAKV
jgi:hypothetical protein